MIKRISSLLRMQVPLTVNPGLLFASGLSANVPVDGAEGYQTGCLYQATDGGAGTSLYVNEGTYAACDFDAVSPSDDSSFVSEDANGNQGAIKGTSLAIGGTGAEVALTATIAQLNALAAIPTSLGSTTSFVVGTAKAPTLIAANASKDRGVLVVVHIDTAFTNATGNQPTLTIGDDSNATKAFAAAKFVSATIGQIFVIGFANTSANNIVAAWTAGTLTATGAATVTVIALPNN